MDIATVLLGALIGVISGIITYWVRQRIERHNRPALEAEIAVLRERSLERSRSIEDIRDSFRQLQHSANHVFKEPTNKEYLASAREYCMKVRKLSRTAHGLTDEERDRLINIVKAETDILLQFLDCIEELVMETTDWEQWRSPPEEFDQKIFKKHGMEAREFYDVHRNRYLDLWCDLGAKSECRLDTIAEIARTAPS